MVEEKVVKTPSRIEQPEWMQHVTTIGQSIKAQPLIDVKAEDVPRIQTCDDELNRVLGGGIVLGSLILVAGEPGIGKSTLFLQCALKSEIGKVLYVSGEESAHQIKMRADRIGFLHSNVYILNETNIDYIFKEIKNVSPTWVIVDSIQTIQSPVLDSMAGSVGQVRECAAAFQYFAKQTNIPVTLIGHITKDGTIAGPKVLEHVVDTVLQFEGDRNFNYRLLRTHKNRFGSTAEIGIYEMMPNGMRGIPNASEILISRHEEMLSGVAYTTTIEGNRAMMIEVQALVSQSAYGTPQRTSNGFDIKRLQLLLAVLEKRGGFHFGMKDVFLNIAGGLKIDNPSIDLAISVALLSSYEDVVVNSKYCFIGEVGLSGEIRGVNKVDMRIQEAIKMGIEFVVIPKHSLKGVDTSSWNIKILEVSKLEEVYKILF
jgi:DNA repair protein RadA/Sms